MKLNGLHLEILTRARETLAETFDADPIAYVFICESIENAANRAVAGSRGIPASLSARSIENARDTLLNAIATGLCGLPTVGAYLRSFCDGMPDRMPELQRIANLARLAWLDRAIDTRELV